MMGAFSRWALIRGWALIRINMVCPLKGRYYFFFFFLLSLFILNIPDARLRQTSKISPPSLVYTVVQNVLHLHFLWVGMLVNSIALGIHFSETSLIFNA